MAVKSKVGIAGSRLAYKPGRPKTTSIGYGQHSRPRRRGKKRRVGQGR